VTFKTGLNLYHFADIFGAFLAGAPFSIKIAAPAPGKNGINSMQVLKSCKAKFTSLES